MTRPLSTYRLQLSSSFTLHDARAIVPYLDELGVDWLYLSPVLRARPGSTHGYDVVDPTAVSDELGGEAALRALSADLRSRDMGLMLDIVPNHMAADERNPWWWDVLRHGRESRWAHAFDIDWDAPGLGGRVLLPVLGERPDEAPLELVEACGETVVAYYDRRFPLAPGTGDLARSDLAAALQRQHYVLAYWQEGLDRINYRRFFDVSDLVALRSDDPEVFGAVHELVLRLVREGVVQGLRVDHVDGLADPSAYLRQLRDAAGDAYIVVEKILARDEQLPGDWPVDGTTGYDFLAVAGGMAVEPRGAEAISRAYVELTGRPEDFEETALAGKREVLEVLFPADLARVARLAPATPDAISELTVHLDVYRTYIGREGASPADGDRLERAAARSGDPAAHELSHLIAAAAESDMPFIRAWQQLTGPVAAKGVEDTALYRDTRLLARNEPGLEPSWLSSTPDDLHAWCRAQSGRHPMTTMSTHDTKRGEDVRSRIAALTLVAGEWLELVDRWIRTDPDTSTQWLLHQTLAGSWPANGPDEDYEQRIAAYLVKALREAKEATSWLAPDEAYEHAVTVFARGLLRDPAFRADLDAFTSRVAALGAAISLAQLAARLIAPGAPDVYWGNETTQLTLVDPDNRRPVDFAANARTLAELRRRHADDADGLVRELSASMPDGRMKLLVTHLGLRLRRRFADVFRGGEYVALDAGPEVLAAARRLGERWVVAVAHLRPGSPVPPGRLVLPADAPDLHDVLLGRPVESPLHLPDLLGTAPVALLTSG